MMELNTVDFYFIYLHNGTLKEVPHSKSYRKPEHLFPENGSVINIKSVCLWSTISINQYFITQQPEKSKTFTWLLEGWKFLFTPRGQFIYEQKVKGVFSQNIYWHRCFLSSWNPFFSLTLTQTSYGNGNHLFMFITSDFHKAIK